MLVGPYREYKGLSKGSIRAHPVNWKMNTKNFSRLCADWLVLHTSMHCLQQRAMGSVKIFIIILGTATQG